MYESANKSDDDGSVCEEEGRDGSTEGEAGAEEDGEQEERCVDEPLDVAHILNMARDGS